MARGRLDNPKAFDVLIIGNGAIGLFLALSWLEADRSLTVGVVGPAERMRGGSQAAGAMLGHLGEVSKDTFRSAAGAAKFDIGRQAAKMWPSVLEKLQPHSDRLLACADDTTVILNSSGGPLDSENYNALLAACQKEGAPYEEVDPEAVEGLRPRPDGRPLRALKIEGEGAVDGRAVLVALERACLHLGATVLDAQASALVLADDRISGCVLNDGTSLQSGIVIVAAGAYSDALLRPLIGDEMQPIFAGVGQAFVCSFPSPATRTVVRTPNRGGACGLHFVPLSSSVSYVGASNVLARYPEKDGFVHPANVVLAGAMTQIDERIGRSSLIEWRVGNRPVTLDGYPLIGRAGPENLYVVSGTYRDGFHGAPYLGRALVQSILDPRGPSLASGLFEPLRDPLGTFTREQSISEYAIHMCALWFEAGGVPPHHVTVDQLSESFKREAERFYTGMTDDVGLPPDVLSFMISSPRSVMASLRRYLRRRA